MRFAAAGAGAHLVPVQRQELRILLRAPGKGIDAIKPEDVVDPKEVKNFPHAVDALAPPIEAVGPHHVPAIKRDAPVLSPLLGKLIVLEIRLRRRAPRPVERKALRMHKDVGAVIADPKRNVAHQRDALPFGVGFHFAPLPVGDPLHVVVKGPALFEGGTLLLA